MMMRVIVMIMAAIIGTYVFSQPVRKRLSVCLPGRGVCPFPSST